MNTSSAGAIQRPEVYESKRIRLTSPILHIGSEVSEISPFEFVERGNKVYLPDTDLLARELLKRGRLDDYIDTIKEKRSLAKFLGTVIGGNWWEITLDGKPIFPQNKVSEKWTDNPINSLRPMIRDGFGHFYIPGSSIKGAIRTAIAYHLLKHADKYGVPQQRRVSEIEKRIRESINRKKLGEQRKFISKNLFMENLFSDFELIYQGKSMLGKLDSSNRDFMRAIHVTDSKPLLPETLINKQGKQRTFNKSVVAEVVLSSHYGDWKAKYKSPIYTEMTADVVTEFTLSLDTEMLDWFKSKENRSIPFKDLTQLLEICKEFAQEQWTYEVEKYWQHIGNNLQGRNPLDFDVLWEKFYSKPECSYSLRLGWATGMNGTTIGCLLDDRLRSDIRDECGNKATGFEAPKSRRTVRDNKGDIRWPLGWVKFEVI